MPTDTFTDSNAVTLPSHDANWATPTNGTTMRVFNDTAVGSAGLWCVNYWNTAFADKHYSICVAAASHSEPSGPAIRVQSGANSFYYAYIDGTTVHAGQLIAGTETDWDAGQTGFADGDLVELSVDPSTATTIHLKKNGSIVQTYTGKSALSGGFSGVCARTNLQADGMTSWEGGDIVGAARKPLAMLLGVG